MDCAIKIKNVGGAERFWPNDKQLERITNDGLDIADIDKQVAIYMKTAGGVISYISCIRPS